MYQLHCHRCKQWLGESSRPMEIVGLFKDARQCELIAPPRDTWRCRACRWVNVFTVAVADRPEQSLRWDEVELKQGA